MDDEILFFLRIRDLVRILNCGNFRFEWICMVCSSCSLFLLIDLAYTWNETWVRMSDEDAEHGYGCIWLFLLIVVSFTLILGSCAVIGIMFWQFGKCADSLVILILTVLLCVVATFLQIFVSEDGSVLTSSIIIAYATYICYSSLTLNPNPVCNPTLSTGYQTVSQVASPLNSSQLFSTLTLTLALKLSLSFSFSLSNSLLLTPSLFLCL
jgi:Serine incorporator (Serinc)